MEKMKTVRIGGTTLTVSEKTYRQMVKDNKEVAMQDALDRRDFVTHERLKKELGK